MVFLLDTGNISTIKDSLSIFPIEGITTNPSILKKEGKLPIYEHLRTIRELIGKERSLHVQVVSTEVETMVEEARRILSEIDNQVYIKVPVTKAGLEVIKILKEEGVGVTATAIYFKAQAYLAIAAGADYIAPYYNRMENLNLDAAESIASLANFIERRGAKTKILGASYKNMAQVNRTLEAGGHCVTVDPSLLDSLVSQPTIVQAVTDFKKDWQDIYGDDATM